MAIFQDNILKQEELNGGFDPQIDGEESFLLNTLDSYPANLPDFNQTKLVASEPELIEVQEPESVIDAEQAEDPDSIWNIFNDESGAIPDIPASEEVPADYSSMFGAEATETTEDTDEILKEETEEIGIVEDPKVAFIGDEATDDEFERMLRAEMERESTDSDTLSRIMNDEPSFGADIQQAAAADLVPEEPVVIAEPEPVVMPEPEPVIILDETPAVIPPKPVPPPVVDDFKPVDGMDGVAEFDLSSVISADHPSTLFAEKIPQPEEPKVEEKPKKEKKVKTPKPPKEKKERKPIGPWVKRAGLIAAIVLISVGISGGLYYFGVFEVGKKFVSKLFSSDTTHVAEVKKDEHKAEPKKEEPKQTEVKHEEKRDTVPTPVHEQAITKQESTEHSAPAKVEEHKTEKPVITEHKEAKPVEKPIVQKEVKQEKQKVEKVKPENKNIAKVEKPKQETKKVVKPESIKPEKKKTVDELYSIQIYASPSKEDANEWVQKLKKKKLGEVYISTQVIRDKVWYRVRCGYYKTKEEAKAAADNLGFSQSWIDRIK